MRNHPNMSYCQLQNTVQAMDQVNDFIMTARDDDLDLSPEEERAMRDLVGYCEQFLNEYSAFKDRLNEYKAMCSL